jgi:hypothetical protein
VGDVGTGARRGVELSGVVAMEGRAAGLVAGALGLFVSWNRYSTVSFAGSFARFRCVCFLEASGGSSSRFEVFVSEYLVMNSLLSPVMPLPLLAFQYDVERVGLSGRFTLLFTGGGGAFETRITFIRGSRRIGDVAGWHRSMPNVSSRRANADADSSGMTRPESSPPAVSMALKRPMLMLSLSNAVGI